MDEAHKELVKRLKRTVYRSDWDDTIVYANPDGVAAADALEALAGEVVRVRVALDIEHDDLNPVTMAETWVNKARVLDEQVVGLLAERDRLKALLPAEMEGRAILFEACPVGHGNLRGENWVKHDCVICERDRLKAALVRLGSVEAFTSSQGICPELYERITYARKALGDAS